MSAKMNHGVEQMHSVKKCFVARSSKFSSFSGVALTFLSLFWAMSHGSRAATGDLDLTFGNGGKVTTDLETTTLISSRITGLTIQPDGKIIAVGIRHRFNDADLAITRYNKDGTPDLSFGVGGRVITDLRDGNVQNVNPLLQADGKIIVAICRSISLTSKITRYFNDGTLDTAFGQGGTLETGVRGVNPQPLAIQSDGKILIAGTHSEYFTADFKVERYNSDGTPDTSFSGGSVITDFFGLRDAPRAIAIQADGKILVAGGGGFPNFGSDFVIVRYNTDGSIDSSFNGTGKVHTDFLGDNDELLGLNITSDGKITAAGIAAQPPNFTGPIAVARYNANGSLDSSFATAGKAIGRMIPDISPPLAVVFQPDGKIVAGGLSFTNLHDFSVTRFNADASVDTSFATAGTAVTDFAGRFDITETLAMQPDGRILVAGSASLGVNNQFAIAAYQNRLPLIASVSVNGKKLVVRGENFDSGASILVDGKKQKTRNDSQNPSAVLIGTKAAKRIEAGRTVTIQIRNADESLSREFRFARP